MKLFYFICFAGFFILCGACGKISTSPLTREPLSFVSPHQDGFVFTKWNATQNTTTRSSTYMSKMLGKTKERGAKFLVVPVFGCQSDYFSSGIYVCDAYPDFNESFSIASKAIEQGLLVTFLPFLTTFKNVEPSRREIWRGYFEPTDLNAWFSEYTKWITLIAAQAQSLHMGELIIASELTKLNQNPERWQKVIREIRKVFEGALIFSINWNENIESLNIWNDVDAIGLSAYFPLSTSLSPTQEELDVAWGGIKEKLLNLSQKLKRPLYFTEVGYRNVVTTAIDPGSFSRLDDSLSFENQLKCYQAFKKTWENEKTLIRSIFWNIEADFTTYKILNGSLTDAEKNNLTQIRYNPLATPSETTVFDFIDYRSRL